MFNSNQKYDFVYFYKKYYAVPLELKERYK